jgi:hypothetical protein
VVAARSTGSVMSAGSVAAIGSVTSSAGAFVFVGAPDTSGNRDSIGAPQSWQNFWCSETSIPQRGQTIRRL